MDKIPYNNDDHPFWEDEDEEERILGLLEPSDFYFYIEEYNAETATNLHPEGSWTAYIVLKEHFDIYDCWYDQHYPLPNIDRLSFKLGCDMEATFSAFDDSITASQAKQELESLGYIYNEEIMEVG